MIDTGPQVFMTCNRLHKTITTTAKRSRKVGNGLLPVTNILLYAESSNLKWQVHRRRWRLDTGIEPHVPCRSSCRSVRHSLHSLASGIPTGKLLPDLAQGVLLRAIRSMMSSDRVEWICCIRDGGQHGSRMAIHVQKRKLVHEFEL